MSNKKMFNEADNMFEELGYKKVQNDVFYFKYYKDIDNVLYFCEKTKSVAKMGEFDGMCCYITMQELKAINKKCDELGF